MNNRETYDSLFMECLDLSEAALGPDLVYQSVEMWDSVGHMQLIAALEDAFDIMLDTDDIIDFSSYEIGMGILKKYEVEL